MRVEERSADQLLMWDFSGRTRSWLMVTPVGGRGSRPYLDSAVVPITTPQGQATMGFRFKALSGFHKLYSRALLCAPRSGLVMSALRASVVTAQLAP